MDWEIPEYAHIPLIHGEDGTKLSKRHGAVNLIDLKNEGYLPSAIINNLILLGWSPKKKNEIIEMEEIIKIFKIDKISKSSSIFDYNKLNYINNHYLKKDNNYKYFDEYILKNNTLSNFMQEDENKVKRIFKIYKNNLNYFSEIDSILKLYFNKSFVTEKNDILNNEFNLILEDFINDFSNIKEWDEETINSFVDNFIVKKKIKFVLFGKPLRFLLTNSETGPSISAILFALGKETSFFRLNNYIRKLN